MAATAKAPGAIDVYDGLHFVGSVRAQAGRYVAYDSHGHRVGTFNSQCTAITALYSTRQP